MLAADDVRKPMDLRLLRYFTAVCEHGSLHAASSVVHVAQPSLSRQIRRLERDLGFALFDRTPRGLVLTAAGRSFLPVAQDLLMRAKHAELTAATIAKGSVTDLSVVTATTTAADIIAPYIVRAGIESRISDVVETIPEQVYAKLTAGEADFAVGTRPPPPALEFRVIGQAYLWAQVPPGHRFAGLDSIHIAELIEEPLITVSSAHYVRHLFDSAVADEGLTYQTAVSTTSPTTAQALAAAGRGVCVLSDDARFGLHSVPIRTRNRDLIISLFGVWEPMHFAAVQIQEVLDELMDFIAELYPQV